MCINDRINALRAQMKQHGVDAYIISSSDPHQSEYVAERWSGRQWISGFTGSAGTVVVTASHAGLWTDSRYFLQAEEELAGTEMQLHKLLVQTQAEYVDWICANIKSGSIVACDFACFSFGQIQSFDKLLTAAGQQLKNTNCLLDAIWPDRPSLPIHPIWDYDIKYAILSRESKLEKIRTWMKNLKADVYLVTALDEIAYLLNLRGSDVECNPLFVSFFKMDLHSATLYVQKDKLNSGLIQELKSCNIEIEPYQEFYKAVTDLDKNSKIAVDPTTLNAKLALLLPQNSLLTTVSPVMNMKAVKSDKEVAHIRVAMAKDGAALVKAFLWLEQQLAQGVHPTEHEMSEKLASSRAEMPDYIGESFHAIVGFKSNGAIIHYRPDQTNSSKIKAEGVLLVDSGGQYLDGTTDITRTIALSEQNIEIKKQYTAVLKGHIDLCQLVFPKGTKGIQMDILARRHLWALGLNYGHGTGHGVGYFMNVHEPPQGFVSAWNQRGMSEFLPGMLTSNEPGFYETGSHGIRIETLLLVQENEVKDFCSFENMSVFPIDKNLIDLKSFGLDYIDWLNNYHQYCLKQISPWCSEEEKKWLESKCTPIEL
ncbi:MAG TPA: aminopeptidase P family protein [Saprospiraceae bacterium]|nr:aminopeptidase P family protein [Saprospiraceae bacterium]